jgi:hypothetical protein
LVAVILAVTILLFTLFGLNIEKISFQKHNMFEFSTTQQTTAIEKSGLKNRSSVFFIKKSKIQNNIESEFPYLKLINIETTFPNKLILHIAQREENFAVKNHSLGFYTILDYEFKALRVLNQTDFEALENKPIVLEFSDSGQINLQAGEFSELNQEKMLISKLSKSFLMHGRDVEEQKHLFKNISLTGDVLVLTLKDNFQIRVHNPQDSLGEKVSAMFSSMSLIYPTYQNGYILEVYKTQNNSLVSKFSIKT